MTSDSQSESGGVVSSTAWLGTVWRHKKKGGIYRLTQTDNRDNVYLEAETKGCRSTWKYTGLLTWDYEQVPNDQAQRPLADSDAGRKGKHETT